MELSTPSKRALPGNTRQKVGFDAADSAGLFVGVQNFKDPYIAAVPYAVDDAIDLAHLLVIELALIEPAQAVLALAGEPKKAATRQALRVLEAAGVEKRAAQQSEIYRSVVELKRRGGENGLCVLTFAGHGFVDQGRCLLLTHGTVRERKAQTSVAFEVLLDDLAGARAPRRLVLLDACREYLSHEKRQVSRDRSALGSEFRQAILQSQGLAVLTASTYGGFAYDDSRLGNGVFTHAVLQGLRGAAAVNDRGLITLQALADHADHQVRTWVEENRNEDQKVSRGIEQRFDPSSMKELPLAVDPGRLAVQESYLQRRQAAFQLLANNLDGSLTGTKIDDIRRALSSGHPSSGRLELLEEIETLDDSERMRRALVAFFSERRSEYLDEPPKAKPAPVVAIPEPHIEHIRRIYGAAWLVLAAIIVFVVAMDWVEWQRGRPDPGTHTDPGSRDNPKAGDQWSNSFGMRFRYIPVGTFHMGSPPDEPHRRSDETLHEVVLKRGFWIGETEVTQAQWQRLMTKNPSSLKSCGDDCPVESVNWYEAVVYANALSKAEDLQPCYRVIGGNDKTPGQGLEYASVKLLGFDCPGYRLPTEAEWEWAARTGKKDVRYETLNDVAWHKGNSGGMTHPVGQKDANAWGLFDMLGNVFEWTADGAGDYPETRQVAPYVEYGSSRVARGGSWGDNQPIVRVAYRLWARPLHSYPGLGFRLVLGPVGEVPAEPK